MLKLTMAGAALLALAACEGNTLTGFASVCDQARDVLATANEAVITYQLQNPNQPLPKVLTDNLATANRLVSICPAVAAAVEG